MSSQINYKPYVLHADAPIGPVLEQLRIANKVGKGKMAQLLGVHADTITRYESDPSTITLAQAVAYCEQLNIQISVCYKVNS